MLFTHVYRTTGTALRISAFATSSRKYSVLADIPVPHKSKLWDSVDEAVKDVKSGDVLLCGGQHISHSVSNSKYKETIFLGFGLAGIPGTFDVQSISVLC